MMILVSGGSKCGKSGFAESLFSDFCGEKIYLATMKPFGNEDIEAKKAIERHRKMRSGKGFSTLEKLTGIEELTVTNGSGILLEDMGNLLANEMFSEGNTDHNYTEKILCGIEKLRQTSGLFVIVTNSVFSDGINYPESTALYIENLSRINRRIAENADKVFECVYGIPVLRKGLL